MGSRKYVFAAKSVCRHPPCPHHCQLRKPPALVSSLILLGTEPTGLCLLSCFTSPWPGLSEQPMSCSWISCHLCGAGRSSPVPPHLPTGALSLPHHRWALTLQRVELELSTVFTDPAWPHSQVSLRHIDSKPFLIQLVLT